MAAERDNTPGIARAVTPGTCPQTTPSSTITLAVGNRHQIALAIDALIDILDQHDRRPQLEITAAGRLALAEARS